MSQARQIVDALVAKPALLYDVLRIIDDEYSVASPWVETPGLATRNSPKGNLMGEVQWSTANPNTRFNWQDFVNGTSGSASSEAAAKDAVDAGLRAGGFLLA